jgi:hypothetical protein
MFVFQLIYPPCPVAPFLPQPEVYDLLHISRYHYSIKKTKSQWKVRNMKSCIQEISLPNSGWWILGVKSIRFTAEKASLPGSRTLLHGEYYIWCKDHTVFMTIMPFGAITITNCTGLNSGLSHLCLVCKLSLFDRLYSCPYFWQLKPSQFHNRITYLQLVWFWKQSAFTDWGLQWQPISFSVR